MRGFARPDERLVPSHPMEETGGAGGMRGAGGRGPGDRCGAGQSGGPEAAAEPQPRQLRRRHREGPGGCRRPSPPQHSLHRRLLSHCNRDKCSHASDPAAFPRHPPRPLGLLGSQRRRSALEQNPSPAASSFKRKLSRASDDDGDTVHPYDPSFACAVVEPPVCITVASAWLLTLMVWRGERGRVSRAVPNAQTRDRDPFWR